MNRKLWLILLIALLNAVGLTIVIPLFPFLIGLYVPVDKIALYLGVLVSIYAVCKFFMAPIMGALSDYFGRIPILFFSLLATAIGYFTLGIGGALWVLFLGRVIAGISAGDISALYAYVADSTEGKERTKLYGYLGAANGIGYMIGPAIGGLLGIEYISLPFYIAGVISVITALFMYFYLPETLIEEKRKKDITINAFNPFSHFKDIFNLKEARKVFVLGSYFFIGLLFYQSNISVYLKDIFAWGPAQIGVLFALIGLSDIASRAILLPRLLIFSERSVISGGLLLMIAGFACVVLGGYLDIANLMYVSIVLITLGEGLFDPSYNNMLSQSVSENKQGQLQGVNQGLHSLYEIFAPFAAGVIYLFNPNAIYIIVALLMMTTLLCYYRVRGSMPAKIVQ
jgi:DHA1 family tetracycline resistance protein-like MFS transporter